ncbi:hypothetical protein NDU88_001265 [Pleurodeles waltl]|uniref:Ammonium transporter AmtB-like domain-containing protein n=1 Tax=Pleurodeles waltl TaxID=8319 RepID=A0AAV7P369_PLEWA|nr:hypothetical protein NDU88_001265 [Pleurodeles waltl]
MRCRLPTLILLLQGALLAMFIVFVVYDEHADAAAQSNTTKPMDNRLYSVFPLFKDIHAMLFVGLGLLLAFMKLYGFSAMAFNFLVGNFGIQWALLVQGFFYHYWDGKIHLGMENVLNAEFASVVVLISAGAVLGKTSPVQLLLMGILEIPLFVVNEWLLTTYLKVVDVSGTIAIHVFACYFGLGVTQILYRPHLKSGHPKEITTSMTDLLSLLGTFFLWIYWPSFNAVLARPGDAQHRAVLNTFIALSSCTMTTFALSSLMNKKGKLNLVHVQNATLAGGVAVGAAADMMITPAGAFGLGCLGAMVCVFGFQYLTPFLSQKLHLQDQCGIHNLHGLPGIVGTVGSIVAILCSSEAIYGSSLYEIFPDRAAEHDIPAITSTVVAETERSPTDQALYQAAGFGVTFAISLVGGYVTGLLLKMPFLGQPPDEFCFDDEPYFKVSESQKVTRYPGVDENGEAGLPLKDI